MRESSLSEREGSGLDKDRMKAPKFAAIAASDLKLSL